MSALNVTLFGFPRFERDGTAIELGRRKAAALAAYLAMSGGEASRETLLALLWPEESPKAARNDLRRSLSLLNRALGPGVIVTDRNRAAMGTDVAVDVRRFRDLLASSSRHGHPVEHGCPRCFTALSEAAGLYKADFLNGFSLPDSAEFDEWTRTETEALRGELADVLERLSGLCEREGDLAASLAAAKRWLSLDRLCEPAHRRVMLLLARAGQRAAALRQYETCARLLRKELQTEPEKETTELYGTLLEKRLPPPGQRPEAWRPKAGRSAGLLRFVLPAAAVLVVALAAGAWWWRGTDPLDRAPAPIAVLPLLDTSAEKGSEWFADGMTEAILTDLAKIKGFRVISHASVQGYRSAPKPVADIGRELGVSYLLEGSVMRVRSRIRITVQLIDARRDSHIWAEDYEREMADVLALQADIARDIANQVKVRLTPGESTRLGNAPAVDPGVYQAYLLGRYVEEHDPAPKDVQRVLTGLTEAVRKDPSFALGYAGLANFYWGATQFGLLSNPEGMSLARRAAEKAVSLDDTLSEAHTVLGFVYYLFDYDWAASEREFLRAIELNPSSSEAHRWYGSLLCTVGRNGEALLQVKEALELDPLSLLNIVNVAARYYYARAYDRTISECRRVLQMNQDFWMAHLMLGYAFGARKMYREAERELSRAFDLTGGQAIEPLAYLGYLYGATGRAAEARAVAQRLETEYAAQMEVSPFLLSQVYLGLGDRQRALDLLEKAYAERDLNLSWNYPEPLFDPLRSEPRFVALKKKMGL